MATPPHTHGGDINVCTIDHDREIFDAAHAARRRLMVQAMIDDEEAFAEGTVAGNLLKFWKWLETNTDTFDPVMIRATMDLADQAKGGLDRESLILDEDLKHQLINDFLSTE